MPICETIFLLQGMLYIDLPKSELLVERIEHSHCATTIRVIPKAGQVHST